MSNFLEPVKKPKKLKTLVIWSAELIGDSFIYNIIAKTKQECLQKVYADPWNLYKPPVKKVIEYRDAFDLYDLATGDTPAHYR